MRKMPFRFARRVRNLEIKSSYYCPTKKKTSYLGGESSHGARRDSSCSSSSSHNQQICPSCVLPIVVAFIFGFTLIQLIVIHRTIVAYKTRRLAFEEAYGPSHNDTKSQGDMLAFSRKFDSALLPTGKKGLASTIFEWKPAGQIYPYRIPPKPSINHGIWSKIKQCPDVPVNLHGNISINIKNDVSLDTLTRENPQVLPGGRWSPKDCSARFHVAVIIPYRYRWKHLKLLLSLLHPMLRRQNMAYQIFVAEQYGNYTFNKGLLMNAAFLLALNSSSTAFDCVIFHDVDLLPETDTNIYGCARSPSHLSVSIDAYSYRLPYSKLVGGVFAISVDHFIQVNGYSNLYWGWGAEDDDMYKRLIANQLPLSRPRPDLAKYKMLQHGHRTPNKFINPLIRTARLRFPQDGLTTCHFRLISSSSTQPLFTHFLVDVGQPSWSVLEPNTHLESMMPTSPPILSLIPPNHRTSSTISTAKNSNSFKHSSSYHHEPSKNPNELFMLSGIARDISSSHHHRVKRIKHFSPPGREPRSLREHLSSHTHQSFYPSTDLSLQTNAARQSIQLPVIRSSSHSQKQDVPLDPDVAVVEEEDEEDEDVDGVGEDEDVGSDSEDNSRAI